MKSPRNSSSDHFKNKVRKSKEKRRRKTNCANSSLHFIKTRLLILYLAQNKRESLLFKCLSSMWVCNFLRMITKHTLKNAAVEPPFNAPYLILVCFARSSALSIGESIRSTVRNAARLAVYDEIMIKVKNHHIPATILVDTALIKQLNHYNRLVTNDVSFSTDEFINIFTAMVSNSGGNRVLFMHRHWYICTKFINCFAKSTCN